MPMRMRACLARHLSSRATAAPVSGRRSELKAALLRDFMPKRANNEELPEELPPYLSSAHLDGQGRGVYIETYGCQMNVADTEVVRAVLKGSNYSYATNVAEADVVLLNTCAIRENAESKIWNRLRVIRAEKQKAAKGWRTRAARPPRGPIVGLLGCMGERLKGKLLEEEKLVDVVCGPDAYRSLPRLLSQARVTGGSALDVALSLDETYADVAPVREGTDGVSAFVSIMRGCNNSARLAPALCVYCTICDASLASLMPRHLSYYAASAAPSPTPLPAPTRVFAFDFALALASVLLLHRAAHPRPRALSSRGLDCRGGGAAGRRRLPRGDTARPECQLVRRRQRGKRRPRSATADARGL